MSGSQDVSEAGPDPHNPRKRVPYPPLDLPRLNPRPWTIPKLTPKVEPLTLSTESLTVQMARWEVNKQEDSFLFTILPPEVRQSIFALVFVQEHFTRRRAHIGDLPVAQPQQRGSEVGYDSIAEDNGRLPDLRITPAEADVLLEHMSLPGESNRGELHAVRSLRQHTALLRTCRLAFCEARDLLMKMTTWRWVEGPDGYLFNFMHLDRGPRDMSPRNMTRYTANRITSFHAFVESRLVENGWIFTRILDMSPARDLTIAIRQNDWDDMPGFNVPMTPYKLELDPYAAGPCIMGTPGLSPMRQHMWETANFGWDKPTRPPIPPISFPPGQPGTRPWADAIAMLPRLERLTLVLEECEDNLDSLQQLVSWAHRVWSFRLGGHMKGYYLSAEDTPIVEKCWRGDPSQWSRDLHEGHVQPPAANNINTSQRRGGFCPGCARRELLREAGLGPRMYSYTINFTAHPLRPEDGESVGVAGPETLSDAWVEPPNDVLPARGMRYGSEQRTLDHELLHPSLRSFNVLPSTDDFGSVADLLRNRDYYQVDIEEPQY